MTLIATVIAFGLGTVFGAAWCASRTADDQGTDWKVVAEHNADLANAHRAAAHYFAGEYIRAEERAARLAADLDRIVMGEEA